MKLKATLHLLMAIAMSSILFISCEDEGEIQGIAKAKAKYVVHMRVGLSGETADYILTADTITSGSISAQGTGIEQIGWRYSASTANTLLSVGYYDDNNAIGYGLDENGNLYEKGKFTFETTLDQFSNDVDGHLVAMEVPRAGFADRVFYHIDGENVKVLAKKSTPIYQNQGDTLVAWPTALVVRGSQLFVPFYTMHANGTFATPSTDTAYVAVYSYPDFEFQKYIKDTRMGPIGIYGNNKGMIQTEAGDLYAYSSSALACGFSTQQRNSGILRINNNQEEFDATYFFDIEEATNGKKIVYFEYVGDGLAVARLITQDAALWSYYGKADICELAVIDLVNKTVTTIEDVPLHKGQYAPMLVEDGTVYVNITSDSGASIYAINATEATALKGATIEGKEIQSLMKFEY